MHSLFWRSERSSGFSSSAENRRHFTEEGPDKTMDPGGYGGAFGGAKAGGAQDPLTFIRRPIVGLRICCLVSAKPCAISKLSYDRQLKKGRKESSTYLWLASGETNEFTQFRFAWQGNNTMIACHNLQYSIILYPGPALFIQDHCCSF